MIKLWVIHDHIEKKRDALRREWKLCVMRDGIILADHYLEYGEHRLLFKGTIQRDLMAALMLKTKGPVHVEDLIEYVYGDEARLGSENTISVHLMRLREKLRPFGIGIMNSHGQGWELVYG